MSDWTKIDIPQFMELVQEENVRPGELVGRVILERLPFTFTTKKEYFRWRDMLAQGLQVDARDVVLVGSACTGRSLNSRTKFGVFNSKSDVDIAIISQVHFDTAWQWFRQANPVLLGFQGDQLHIFKRHKEGYVFDGMIAANSFLSYLPFGSEWNRQLQLSEQYLPSILQGRVLSVRIYRDSEALRRAQMRSLQSYQSYLRVKYDSSSEGGSCPEAS